MKMRTIFMGTIIASSVLLGADSSGEEVITRPEAVEKYFKLPYLGLDKPLRHIPIRKPLKAEKQGPTGSQEVVSKDTQPPKKESPPPIKEPKVEKKQKPNIPPKPKKNYTEMTVVATAYVSFCDTGCIGITATGTSVKKNIYHSSGLPIIATDPRVIPLGTIVEIEGRKFISDDTGGSIKGNRIDILVDTHDTSKAFEFGRQKLNIKVFN